MEIEQDNDSAAMYTDPEWIQSWSENSVGQILMVESVSGNTITLNRPLYIDYTASLNPRIRTQGFVEYAGVEKLHLERLDTGDGHMIQFKNAAYCWMRLCAGTGSCRSMM